jgi:hypothetical protein
MDRETEEKGSERGEKGRESRKGIKRRERH